MAIKPTGITLDDSFSAAPPASEGIPLDDTFSNEPVALDDSFTAAPAKEGLIPVFGAEGQAPANAPKREDASALGTIGDVFNSRIEHQGGWGLSPETRKEWGADDTNPGSLRNILPDALGVGWRGLQAVQAGLETGAIGLDAGIDATGINTLLPDQYNIRPGSALMALLEANPQFAGSPELAASLKAARGLPAGDMAGIKAPVEPHRLSPEVEAGYQHVADNGTAEQILAYAKDNNFAVDPATVQDWVQTRTTQNQGVTYLNDPAATALKAEADAFTNRPKEASPLQAEADAFKPKEVPEPTPDTLFPSEEFTAAKTKAMEDRLTAEADAFKGKPVEIDDTFTAEPEVKAETPSAPVEVDSSFSARTPEEDAHLTSITDEVNKTVEGWKNAPEIEVVHSIDDITDPAVRARVQREGGGDILGLLGEDGKVRIIAGNIKNASEVPAIVFHEGLGHHGLAQKFGADLQSTLKKFYDEGIDGFKEKVDTWLEENPTAYKNDPDRIAAATEEVLAEMSESGQISPRLMDRITNHIKDYGRKAGLDLKYSEREIRTILGMAHDAVVSGKGSVAENGFRYKMNKEQENGNDYRIAVMPDGSTVNTLINKDGHILDTMDYRGPGGSHLPEEFKPTPEEVSLHGKERYKKADTRRDKIKAATEELSTTAKGETKTTKPFPDEEPDYHRFRHVTQDGKAVTGTYTVGEGKLRDFSINSEGGARSIGPSSIRHIARDLLKEHPEAKGIDGFRISGARPVEEYASSGTRFARRKFDEEHTPDRVYFHGSPVKDLKEIVSGSESSEWLGNHGIYVTPNEGLANVYGRMHSDKPGQVYKVNVDIKNPLVIDAVKKPGGFRTAVEKLLNDGRNPRDVQMTKETEAYKKSAFLSSDRIKELKEAGYDGIINRHSNEVVVFDKKQIKMLEDDTRFARRKAPEEDSELGLPRNPRAAVEALTEGYKPEETTRSWAEAKRNALDTGLTMKDIKGAKTVGELDKRLFQYDNLARATDAKLAKLGERLDGSKWTLADKQKYMATINENNLLMGHILGDQAEVGRALNAMKAVNFSKKNLEKLNALMKEYGGPQAILASDEEFMRFAKAVQALQQAGNTAGVQNMLKQTVKPYWWQYALTFRHSAMLSGIGTHAKNITDNTLMIAREFEEAALALPIHVVRRAFGLKPGVTPAEVSAHAYGLLRALADGATYRDTFNAAVKGHANHQISSKIEMADARIPIISKVGDLLHAQDTFFRAFMENANLYKLGVRDAQARGLKGMAAFQDGSNIAMSPLPEMIKQSQKMADTSLLVAPPQLPFGTAIESAKSVRPGMGGMAQAQAAMANFIFPFFRVSDQLLFQKLRRTPLSFLDKITREDIKAGGARRDIAIARTAYGSALLGYYWHKAASGDTEGGAPEFKKKAALEAGGYLPNSVKEKDGSQYTDASALNLSLLPTDLHNQLAADMASIYKAFNTKSEEVETTGNRMLGLGQKMMTMLASNSFAENVSTYTKPFEETGMGENGKDTALANMIGGAASQFVPAALRQYNNISGDPIKRDTSGDKTKTDRIYGRIMSGIPSIPGITDGSKGLPVKYSVYGEEQTKPNTLLGMSNFQKIDKRPVVQELQRLERTQPKPIVTAPSPSFSRDGVPIKLNGEAYAEFSRVRGWYFLQGMSRLIDVDGWKKANDDLKKEAIKDLLKEATGAAKDQLYPSKEEPETVEDTNDN